MLDLLPKKIEEYCVENSSKTSSHLQKIARQSYLRTNQGHMISGALQGAFIAQLVQLASAKRVLEIGTFTGYTAVAIAEVLGEQGMLTTVEINPENHHIAHQFIQESSFSHKVNLLLGDAKKIVGELEDDWDIILIDAAKKDNEFYYELLLPKMKVGAFFLLDNVLWKGKVTDEVLDKKTEEIHKFNQRLATDSRVQVTLLPIRDGITIIRKL